MELDELLKEELDIDSPDFTAEEAESAVETTSEDDFAGKATEYLKGLIADGGWGKTNYQRKKFRGSNYLVLRFGESKKVFKMAWILR